MQHRSPIIPWLLLAATISVDIVVHNWLLYDNSLTANTVYAALVTCELSIVCIWSGLTRAKTIWARVAPWLAVFVATVANVLAVTEVTNSPWQDWVGWALAVYTFQAALLMAALWLVERTRFWQRRTGAAAKWQFSLSQLLTITTVVAVLAAVIHNYEFHIKGIWHQLAYIGAMVVLSVASAITWSLSWHWLLRLEFVLALAIALGAAVAYDGYYGGHDLADMLKLPMAYFIIQALVISIWLVLGSVLPTSTTSAAVIEH